MKKCVIFGAGNLGRKSYYKLNQFFEVLYFVDNNVEVQGKEIYETEIISMDRLQNIYNEELYIIICSMAYREMAEQLFKRNIKVIHVMIEGLLYQYTPERYLVPLELSEIEYYKKNRDERSVVFIQRVACTRTNKIAKMVKKRGYRVFLCYMLEPSMNAESVSDIYDGIYTVFTLDKLNDFIQNSDFEIIHSSNAPDYLSAFLLKCNKPLIHDCHDMMNLMGFDSYPVLITEHMASSLSAGVIYTSEGVKKIAEKKFKRSDDNIFVLENYISNEIRREKNYPKLNSKDGRIHCVYEGGMMGGNPNSDRFFENIWKEIIDCGIHIHFYTQYDPNYCKRLESMSEYLHYEGNFSSNELANEMTKYDCGLSIFNTNDNNRALLETATANKIYEYINSGIPVIVGDVQSQIDFVTNYGVGIQIDFSKDIKMQIKEACLIQIEDDFLKKHEITMESKCDALLAFYEQVRKTWKSQ